MDIFYDPSSIITNASKATSRPMVTHGVYVGKVVRIDDDGRPYITIPKVNPNTVFGPCKSFSMICETGDIVAVTFLDNRLDEAVIIGNDSNVSHISITAPTVTTSYTLQLSDDGKLIELNSSSANILYVPTDSTPFSIGTQITVVQNGTGATTIASTTPGTTSLLYTPGLKLRARYSSATLIKKAAEEWYVFGDLAA